jgi:hypothetical protein
MRRKRHPPTAETLAESDRCCSLDRAIKARADRDDRITFATNGSNQAHLAPVNSWSIPKSANVRQIGEPTT